MIYFFPKYGELGASSRLRSYQFIRGHFDSLLRSGQLLVSPLIDDSLLASFYSTGHYSWPRLLSAYLRRIWFLLQLRSCDHIYIEKELFPMLPFWFEFLFLRNVKYCLDFDDAIFHNYDLSANRFKRLLLSKKLSSLAKYSAVSRCGNFYLLEYCRSAGCRDVRFFPTVVRLDKYDKQRHHDSCGLPSLVWIGSPSTKRYLMPVLGYLLSLSDLFSLTIIGLTPFETSHENIVFHPWSSHTEVSLLASCDVGIMPLEDGPWERGKCAYKLIQYMACGLPVIASPVGFNCHVVKHGKNGFFASTGSEWIRAAASLINDLDLRRSLGGNGRRFVEQYFSSESVVDSFLCLD